jgi:tetratricopeptide (TPR) repeat protein
MKKLLVIFVLVFSISVFAGPNKFKEVDLRIMNHLYNAELGQADSLLNLRITQEPENPKYYMMKAHYHFYSRYFTQGLSRDSILQLIVTESQKAITLAENMEESAEQKFYLGSAYGFLSRAFVMQQEYWDGYWAAKECRNYLEDVIDEDPNFADAYVGLGVIEYFTGRQYTGFYNFLVWFVGMSGDRQVGIDYFTNTAQKGELLKNEADFILGTIYSNQFMENDPTAALAILVPLRQKFPNNPVVERNYQTSRFVKMVNEKGVAFLETEFDSLQTKYEVTNAGVLNLLGYTYMNQNRLDDALVVLKTNLKLFPDLANSYDSLAECYFNRGENDLAIKYYKIAYEKLDTDTTITDAFRNILKEGIPERLEALGAEVNKQT